MLNAVDDVDEGNRSLKKKKKKEISKNNRFNYLRGKCLRGIEWKKN